MIEKIALGLFVTVVGSLLLYAFRMRQLYVVLPRLFSVSALTSTGKLVELRVFNNGRATEEDVVIALAPSRRYEIIASTDSSPILTQHSLRVPRIPPGDDFSVLLMIEGGDFTKNEISTVSSKTTKGKVLDGVEKVPPNVGNALLGLAVGLMLLAAPISALEYHSDWKKGVAEQERTQRIEALAFLIKNGWSSLEGYSDSAFRQNYKPGEFPLYQKKLKRKGNVVFVTFGVTNKAAAELSINVLVDSPHDAADPEPWDNLNVFSHAVSPSGAYEFTVRMYWPKGKVGDATVRFTLSVAAEDYLTVVKSVHVDV